jgi:hypothetical protein
VLCRPRRQAPIFDILDDASTARDDAPTIASAQLLPLRQGADAMIVYLYQPLNKLNKLLPTADEKFPTGAMASFPASMGHGRRWSRTELCSPHL